MNVSVVRFLNIWSDAVFDTGRAGPWAGLGMGLGWAYNLEISTGSGRAWAEKFQIIWIDRGSHLYSKCHKPY